MLSNSEGILLLLLVILILVINQAIKTSFLLFLRRIATKQTHGEPLLGGCPGCWRRRALSRQIHIQKQREQQHQQQQQERRERAEKRHGDRRRGLVRVRTRVRVGSTVETNGGVSKGKKHLNYYCFLCLLLSNDGKDHRTTTT